MRTRPVADARFRMASVIALLGGNFLVTTAVMAETTVLGKQVYDLTGRVFDLGLLGLAEFAPAALLVLVTGSVADRFDRRKVAAISIGAEAIVAGLLAWYATTRPTSATPIFLMVLGFGCARGFAAPAARSLPADIVPSDRLPWLVARFAATWQSAIVVGPVLGGFLYTRGVWWPYAAAVVLLGAGALVFLAIQVAERGPVPAGAIEAPNSLLLWPPGDEPVPATRGAWHEAIEGLRFIRRQPVLLGAISLDLFAVLFGGAVALLPAIAEDRLGVGAFGLGWLRAAGGLGAAIVTVVLAVRPVHRRVGRTLLIAVGVFGAGTVALGITHMYAVAFVALAVLSGADAVSVFVRATLVPLVTPPEKRGRVLAVENVFIGASNELGAFESGTVGQLIGTAGAVVLGGLATLTIAVAWWVLFPGLRNVDRFPTA